MNVTLAEPENLIQLFDNNSKGNVPKPTKFEDFRVCIS